MHVHARYLQSLTLGLAGSFVVVASQSFASDVTAWLAFAVGVAAVLLAFTPALAGERRGALAVDVVTGILASWTIVASLVFSGATVRWLSFAEALGLVGLAVVGLTVSHVRLARAARVSRPVSDTAVEAGRPTAMAA